MLHSGKELPTYIKLVLKPVLVTGKFKQASLIFAGKDRKAPLKIAPTNCLYYKHVTVVNDDSSVISKWSFKLIDDPRVVIYNHHRFILQATTNIELALNDSKIQILWLIFPRRKSIVRLSWGLKKGKKVVSINFNLCQL